MKALAFLTEYAVVDRLIHFTFLTPPCGRGIFICDVGRGDFRLKTSRSRAAQKGDCPSLILSSEESY